MKLNFDEIKEILLCYPEGISLDDLLIIMDMDVINQNRINVISILKWHDEVKSRLLCKMLYNVFTISTYQN